MAGFSFSTPDWLNEINGTSLILPDIEDRARFVIEASRRNVAEGTGVPFAAAVFDIDGRLVALGVNLALKKNAPFCMAKW